MTTEPRPTPDDGRNRLLSQAGAIAAFASAISFGHALYLAWGGSFWSVLRDISLPVASAAPAVAVLLIAMEERGLRTPTARAAAFLNASGVLALLVFAVGTLVILTVLI